MKGRIVLLDFWTYCCINCLHVIPILKQLEEIYKELLVIGIHSAKFTNEKSKKNINYALHRHLIKHPVVCDNELDLWTSLEINCWPTFMILNPYGQIIAEFQGEIQANLVKDFIRYCFEYYEKDLLPIKSLESLEMKNLKEVEFSNELCFPTKLCLGLNKLFISDSGNNRIIAVDCNTIEILYTIGGLNGYQDGLYEEAKFNWPQGLAIDVEEQRLYIADTDNNIIRAVDLQKRVVSTLCGKYKKDGVIGNYDYIGGKQGLEQEVSSPWDICLYKRDNNKFLFIACAGTHQIWMYTFKTTSELTSLALWKNVTLSFDTLVCVAGNGKERNRNNSYPLQASFAQPSGLCLDIRNNCLFIADAESSTVRMLSLKDGSVKNIVGGDSSQPDNLFVYGDVDGVGAQVRLQHPMDIKCLNEKDLLIADTYNNKLKLVNINTKLCRTFVEKDFSEPNGLFVDEVDEKIFIADTNNHLIKVVDAKTQEIAKLNITFLSEVKQDNVENRCQDMLVIKFEDDIHINHEAPNSWSIEVFVEKGNYRCR